MLDGLSMAVPTGDVGAPSIYVKFKLDAMPGVFEASGAEGAAYLLIWTTTPWTLPANTAVSLALSSTGMSMGMSNSSATR